MGKRILVVDDERQIRGLLSKFLGQHGFAVMTARDAVSARQLLAENDFALMVCDIYLEHDDGLELLAAVKLTHPQLPVIMMTGMGFDEELMNEAMRKQAAAYVSKTIPLPNLLTEIARVLKDTPGKAG